MFSTVSHLQRTVLSPQPSIRAQRRLCSSVERSKLKRANVNILTNGSAMHANRMSSLAHGVNMTVLQSEIEIQKQMHSIRKDVFIQQTENNFISAYVDDAIHADLHLLASLPHLEQTEINYLHTMPPTRTT